MADGSGPRRVDAGAVILTNGPGTGGLLIAWQSIWFPVGRSPDDKPVYVPTSEPWMVASDGHTFHATDTTLKVHPRRRTVDTACGKRARRFGVDWIENLVLLPVWPTPAKWSDAHRRCPDCFVATGKRRPHVMYRGTSWRPRQGEPS